MSISKQLTSGFVIIVDKEFSYLLEKFLITTMRTKAAHTRYAVVKDKTTRKYLGLLHRIVMNAKDDEIIDHENGNGLDCRKQNLRNATLSQNQFNRRRSVNNTKCVWFRKDRQKWIARIGFKNKIITLGHFNTEAEAIMARKEAELKYHGNFAGLGTEKEI